MSTTATTTATTSKSTTTSTDNSETMRANGASKNLEYLKPVTDAFSKTAQEITKRVPPSVVQSMKNLKEKYQPEIEHLRLDHPLVTKVLALVFICFSIICPPLAVGLYALGECKKTNKSGKHTFKVVVATMALCVLCCFFLFVPGILYCWVAMLGTSSKTIPYWSSEDKLFSWL